MRPCPQQGGVLSPGPIRESPRGNACRDASISRRSDGRLHGGHDRGQLDLVRREPALDPDICDLYLGRHSGMLPCFRRGISSRLLCSIVRLLVRIRRVSAGSMTSST